MEIINTTEFRNLPAFDKIKIKSLGNIFLTFGSGQSVRIEAKDNVARNIVTEVILGELIISYRKFLPVELISSPKVEIYIETNVLNAVTVTGGSKIIGRNNFTLDKFYIFNGGIGSINMNVNANLIDVRLSGVGKVEYKGNPAFFNYNRTGIGTIEHVQ